MSTLAISWDNAGSSPLMLALERNRGHAVQSLLRAVVEGGVSRTPAALRPVLECFPLLARAYPREFLALLRDMPLAQVFAHLSQFCAHPAIALHFDFPANLLAQFYRSQLSRQERKDGLVWELLRFTEPPSELEEIEFTVPREGRVVGVA